MRKRMTIYCLGLLAISIFIFVYNTILDMSPQLMWLLPLDNHTAGSWISLVFVIVVMVIVRCLFEPKAKYRVMTIITLFVLFLVISLSVTIQFNGPFGLFRFYRYYPRYWIYIPMIILTAFLVWLLVRFTKNLTVKTISLVFWIVDIVYSPLAIFATFLTYFSGQ